MFAEESESSIPISGIMVPEVGISSRTPYGLGWAKRSRIAVFLESVRVLATLCSCLNMARDVWTPRQRCMETGGLSGRVGQSLVTAATIMLL